MVTGHDERVSAQLGHMDGGKSMTQCHYIHQGIRHVVDVDNADVLELLNPFKMAPNSHTATLVQQSKTR